MDQSSQSEKPSQVPLVEKRDDESDSDSDSDMPNLEDIKQEINSESTSTKKIKGVQGEGEPASDEDDERTDEEKDGWVDILSNGDLLKKTLKEGPEANRPPRGSKVLIRLLTRLYTPELQCENGKTEIKFPILDATGPVIEAETFDKFTLVIGDLDLHQGLDLLLPLMDLKETARLLIKPRFAYGPIGNKHLGIPGDSILDIEVELLEIQTYSNSPYGDGGLDAGEPNPIVMEESLEERIHFGNYKKNRGNFWFERGEYSLAISCYRGAIKYLDASEQELALVDKHKNDTTQSDQHVHEIEDLIDKRAQTYNNLAASQMKMQAFDSALRSVEDSLLLRPNNVKAMYRRAKIRVEKGMLEEAIEDLRAAAKIDPNSEAVALELDRLTKILNRQLHEQRQLYRRMMQVKEMGNSSSSSTSDTSSKSKNTKDNSQHLRNGHRSKPAGWLAGRLIPSTAVITGLSALALAGIIPALYSYFK